MGAKVYVTDGGGPTATDVDFSSQVPLFDKQGTPQVDLGMACDNGSASQGTFIVFDPIGEIPRADGTKHLSAHNRVLLTVDASGIEYWLSRGRVGQKNIGRHPISKAGAARQHEVQVDDANVDLRGLALREAVSRPAETGWQRLAFFHAYTLAGSASTAPKFRDTTTITFDAAHLAPNTNTVTMPAKTYPAGSDLVEIINECRDTEAKAYAVVIHHTGGSHLCALYIDPGDHTTYASTCRISDSWDEYDPDGDLGAPTFYPVYDMGPAATEDGQELAHAIVSTWGVDQVADVEQLSTIEGYDYWAMPYYDAQSQNATQAAQVAAAQLTENKLEHVTHQLSILVRESKAHLIAAGMSIQVKAAATMGGQYLNTWQTRRIALCKWQPAFPNRPGEELWWWAHLNLDRAFGNVYSRGNRAIATAPKPPSAGTADTVFAEWTFSTEAGAGTTADTTGTYTFAGNTDDNGNPGKRLWFGNAGTGLSGHTGSGGVRVPVNAGDSIRISLDAVPDSAGVITTFTVKWYAGGSLSSSETIGSADSDAGITPISKDFVVPAGVDHLDIWASNDVFATSGMDNVKITLLGTAGDTISAPSGDGTIGTSNHYMPIDTVLPAQTAADTPVADTAGNFTGTDVEAVLAELQDNIDGVTSGGTSGSLVGATFPPFVNSPQTGNIPLDAEGRIEITNTSRFSAYPFACVMGNGQVLLVYTDGTHSSDGKIVGKISSDGINFGAEFTILDTADDLNVGGLTALPNGRVLLSIGANDLTSTSAIYTKYSDDFGQTWSDAAQADDDYAYSRGCWSPPVLVNDGVILLPVQGRDTSTGKIFSKALKSTNGGLTFGSAVTMATSATKELAEPQIVLLPDGTLVSFIRNQTDFECWRGTSDDNGATWTTPSKVFDGYGRLTPLRTASGGIVIVYRDAVSPHSVVYRTSWNDGVTWEAETDFDADTALFSTHACPIEYAPGHIAVFYSVWDESGDADIYLRFMYDGSGMDLHGNLIEITTGASALDDLSDVAITSATTGDMIAYNGSAWVNQAGEDVFSVDPGTISYSGTTPTISVTSVWGINSSGVAYYNSAGVTSGDEAALMRNATTGDYFLRPYNF